MNGAKVGTLAMCLSHANDLRHTMVQTTSRHQFVCRFHGVHICMPHDSSSHLEWWWLAACDCVHVSSISPSVWKGMYIAMTQCITQLIQHGVTQGNGLARSDPTVKAFPPHDESSTSMTMNGAKVGTLAMCLSHANDLRHTMVQTTSRHQIQCLCHCACIIGVCIRSRVMMTCKLFDCVHVWEAPL